MLFVANIALSIIKYKVKQTNKRADTPLKPNLHPLSTPFFEFSNPLFCTTEKFELFNRKV